MTGSTSILTCTRTNAHGGMHACAYRAIGNTAIEACNPRLTLVYDRDAMDVAAEMGARQPKAMRPSRPSRSIDNGRDANAAVSFGAGLMLRVIVIAALAICCSMAFECLRSTKVNQVLDSAPTEEVMAVSGDSIWSIAEQYGGNKVSTEDMVTWIRSRNELRSAMLTPGQRICVPVVAY